MTQTPLQRDEKNAAPAPKANGGPPRGGAQAHVRQARDTLLGRTVTITLSLPKAVFSVLFVFFILIWVFIFGIMLGRGHNPEDVVPELAKVMPAPAATAEPGPETAEVLPRSELQYHESLKGKNAGEKPRVVPVAPPPPPAQEQAAAKPAEKSAEKPAPQKSPPAGERDKDQAVYNYLYQVAASNNAESADALRKKLEAAGFSARVVRSVSNNATWYRILVSFRGRPEETRTLRGKLAEFGIKDIILREKAPSR